MPAGPNCHKHETAGRLFLAAALATALLLGTLLVRALNTLEPVPPADGVGPDGPNGRSGRPDWPACRINVNTADPATLQLLPGIGQALAQRIVEQRQEGGPFAGPEDLARRVKGIGDKTLAELQPWACYESLQPGPSPQAERSP